MSRYSSFHGYAYVFAKNSTHKATKSMVCNGKFVLLAFMVLSFAIIMVTLQVKLIRSGKLTLSSFLRLNCK